MVMTCLHKSTTYTTTHVRTIDEGHTRDRMSVVTGRPC